MTHEGGYLDDHTDDHNNSAREDHPPTTRSITENEGEDSTRKTTQFVDGRHQSLHDRIILGGCEDVVERLVTDNTRHDTLYMRVSLTPRSIVPTELTVISKQQETHSRNSRDRQGQRSARHTGEGGRHDDGQSGREERKLRQTETSDLTPPVVGSLFLSFWKDKERIDRQGEREKKTRNSRRGE